MLQFHPGKLLCRLIKTAVYGWSDHSRHSIGIADILVDYFVTLLSQSGQKMVSELTKLGESLVSTNLYDAKINPYVSDALS
jgi:hypothetical protein